MHLKQQLLDACKAQLSTKIAALENALATIQESKNNETKSSAGDKYETGRAMMQMEADKIDAQLDLAKNMLHQVRQIKPSMGADIAGVGSLVRTDQRTYLIAVSLGKLGIEGESYYCISPQAPLAKLMMGKRAGDLIELNGRPERIVGVG